MAEKTIKIGEKSVILRANASFLLIYKDQFGREALTDIFPLLQMAMPVLSLVQGEELGPDAAMALGDGLSKFDTDVFIKILWAMAKNADHSLPDPETWIESFDVFPLIDIIAEITPFALDSLISKKKQK